MHSKVSRLALLIVAAVALALAGCSKDEADKAAPDKAAKVAPDVAADKAKIGKLTVDTLAAGLGDKTCVPVDANGTETRAEHGVIPGAVLLTNYRKFGPDELPADKDKKLVFYCSNEQCGASHAAAEKALLAGYSDVHILPAGIMGWKKAGQPTQTVQ